MNINPAQVMQQYQNNQMESLEKKVKMTGSSKNETDEKLRTLSNEFVAILMKQMFKAMRDSVPESGFIDGGFAEDVFTDMLDDETSKAGAAQDGYNSLGKMLYQQLKNSPTNY